MTSQFFSDLRISASDGLAGWVRRVATAALTRRDDATIVTYGGVRVQWIRRSLADYEARAALSRLCRAAAVDQTAMPGRPAAATVPRVRR
jgi:hypothetical protein